MVFGNGRVCLQPKDRTAEYTTVLNIGLLVGDLDVARTVAANCAK